MTGEPSESAPVPERTEEWTYPDERATWEALHRAAHVLDSQRNPKVGPSELELALEPLRSAYLRTRTLAERAALLASVVAYIANGDTPAPQPRRTKRKGGAR